MFMQTTSMPWPGWILTGLGLRLLQDLGAHRKNDSPPSVSGELWKRAFWTINYIDLLLALNVGRPRETTPDERVLTSICHEARSHSNLCQLRRRFSSGG